MHEAPWRPSCAQQYQNEQFHIQKAQNSQTQAQLRVKDGPGTPRKLLRNQQSGEDGGSQNGG